MTYQIQGLDPAQFQPLFEMSEDALATSGARRVTANASRGFPCRVSLADAAAGTELILLNHVSHDVETPYRSAYAIYVSAGAEQGRFIDTPPPVFEGRPLGLRAFDAAGMLKNAMLALPGEADAKIRQLFGDADIATVHAHNAAHGCFVACIERN